MKNLESNYNIETLSIPTDTVNQDVIDRAQRSSLKTMATKCHRRSLSPAFLGKSLSVKRKESRNSHAKNYTLGEDLNDKSFDYCATPSTGIQSKIDYFIFPYNHRVNCAKHMTFDPEKASDKRHSSQERTSGWKNIRKMILQQDVRFLHHNLNNLNEGLVRATQPPKEIREIFAFGKKKKQRKQKKSPASIMKKKSLILNQFKSRIPNFSRLGTSDINRSLAISKQQFSSSHQNGREIKNKKWLDRRNKNHNEFQKVFTNNGYYNSKLSPKQTILNSLLTEPIKISKPSEEIVTKVKEERTEFRNRKLRINPEKINRNSICSTKASFNLLTPEIAGDAKFFNTSITVPSTAKGKRRKCKLKSIASDIKKKRGNMILNVYSPEPKVFPKHGKIKAFRTNDFFYQTII
ncbi:unnamed protein product [Moneuplotes crassus]|uniref:Uncharacterized protein n=1 Tax=Euplotes crassus TaxID=5936 RepID=A0AAD1X6I1_EUPCR|nr:unnamed protein product [Moneuplotes crassus]